MTDNTTLRVDRMSLQNFRCFADCAIEFHPDLTVLVAENGQGKTAILDAFGVALGLFVDTLAGTRQFHGFNARDVRLVGGPDQTMSPALPTSVVAEGYVAGDAIHWSRTQQSHGRRARTSSKDALNLRASAIAIRKNVERAKTSNAAEPSILPLVAFYRTGRLWSEQGPTAKRRPYSAVSDERLAGYIDCLSSSSSFRGMIAWYESKMSDIGDPKFSTELSRSVPLITAVRQAIRTVLEPTGWCELDWDNVQRSLVVGHSDHGRLALSMLSDGVRNMLALIADIARRCASLNPDLKENAAQRTPGVLLIDEVDLHLHPRWQQQVVQLLREAFPLLQLIVTTHSPHVLSTVEKSSIRVISLRDGHGLVEIPAVQTRGVESADVLASIMHVDPKPRIEEAVWLRDYRALIEDGKGETDDAGALRSKLISHFGEDHPVMLDCQRLMRFQAFKLKRNRPEET
jgi:predicted ATP-binding protein involved in virulence